jgi:hypothetical protein
VAAWQAPPILATGFHSGVAAVVSTLFEWTEEGACGGDSGDPKLTSCDEYVKQYLANLLLYRSPN